MPTPETGPADPTYLAADLAKRLAENAVSFRFMVQLRTDPATMPLDESTVAWDEKASPPIHVANLILHKQDVNARGQAQYGENLAWNIWRVTAEHTPQGSIADARRVVYSASSELRRGVNGVPDGEPERAKDADNNPPCADTTVVRAAIHPAIGIARIGDSEKEFFVGPEVLEPLPEPPNFYRDPTGALKRQAARFAIYGYNAAGQVVGELTANNANVKWTVISPTREGTVVSISGGSRHSRCNQYVRAARNPDIPVARRGELAIDPGPRSISGPSVSGGPEHTFDTGAFKTTIVPLGGGIPDGRRGAPVGARRPWQVGIALECSGLQSKRSKQLQQCRRLV